ncbi:MAG: type II toxin-antitoxin system RelE/ParE family toxin [Balneola sp.]|nr:type II toxin-antitoxin system RelE/ParE family toxin [Balneola sp.]MBO6650673.1 type II toxin-antitoxin system RelE/ParE family toxin [Balneola sp.]MBO6710585.1 type II toxin-antitoxin system RelE/ParE family toxin [Balneola sp.]MBO6799271.1 type II toxin-antitoxin system RelE/ParE family toxin [Balneola sp.]MBO6869600.1 type II toxin-antitoxin system RelE/ParE family toxin [Balneola sp.]
MSFSFELEDQAKKDFWSTFDYYAKIDQDLAFKFSLDFENSVEQILQFPDSGLLIGEGFHRILLSSFPNYIIYKKINEDLIVCFAVGHTRRKPDYWKE